MIFYETFSTNYDFSYFQSHTNNLNYVYHKIFRMQENHGTYTRICYYKYNVLIIMTKGNESKLTDAIFSLTNYRLPFIRHNMLPYNRCESLNLNVFNRTPC